MADLNNVDEFASDENYLEIDNLTDFSVSGSEEYVPTESSDYESSSEDEKIKHKKKKKYVQQPCISHQEAAESVPGTCTSNADSENPLSGEQSVDAVHLSANTNNINTTGLENEENTPENHSASESLSSDAEQFGPDTRRKKRRFVDPSIWEKNIRKRKRNSGQTYVTTTGKIQPAKICPDFNCNCRLMCVNKINFQQCCDNFKLFYSNSSWETQMAYIINAVKVVPIKRKIQKEGSKRNQTREFYLRAGTENVVVCKEKFMKTLQIDSAKIHRALKKSESCSLQDKRGKHVPANKTADFKVQDVHNHIKSIPSYTSHYRRNDTPDSRYLDIGLNICKMYELYRESMKQKYSLEFQENEKEWSKKYCVQKPTYQRIFWRDFGHLKFKQPRKDTCKTCDRLRVEIDAAKCNSDSNLVKQLEVKLQVHHRQVELANSSRENDIKESTSVNVHTVSFDLQKTFPLPKISTNEVYYKRQLTVYNLGIHNMSTQQAYMHVWHEGIASRGAQEVSSCLIDYIKKHVSSEKFVLWSDACGGQNRNIKFTLAMMFIVAQDSCPVNEIVHKFCVSGHSYLPNDRDFSQIENKVRQTSSMYSFEDFKNIVSSSKQNKQKFVLRQMETSYFYSTDNLNSLITNRKKSFEHEQIQWLRIRETRVAKSNPGVLFYKYTHNPQVGYYEIDFRKKKNGPPPEFNKCQLCLLYPHGLCVSQAKLKDIHHLLKYVPPVHHPFYLQLKSAQEDTDENDIDGLPEVLDFTPEEED